MVTFFKRTSIKDKPKKRDLHNKENFRSPERQNGQNSAVQQLKAPHPPVTAPRSYCVQEDQTPEPPILAQNDNSLISSKYKVVKTETRPDSPPLSSSSFSTTTHEDSKNFKNGRMERSKSPEIYKPENTSPLLLKDTKKRGTAIKLKTNKPEKPRKPKNLPRTPQESAAANPTNKKMNRYNHQEFPPPPPSSVLKATKNAESTGTHQAVVSSRAQTYTQNSQTTRNPSGSALTNERGYTSQDSQHGSSGYASVGNKNKDKVKNNAVRTVQAKNENVSIKSEKKLRNKKIRLSCTVRSDVSFRYESS